MGPSPGPRPSPSRRQEQQVLASDSEQEDSFTLEVTRESASPQPSRAAAIELVRYIGQLCRVDATDFCLGLSYLGLDAAIMQ